MNPRVSHVAALEDFRLLLTFTNGEQRLYDMRPHLELGVFRELKDPSYFKTVRAAMGTVEWPNGQDHCPDTLYEGSTPIGGAGV